MIPEFLSDGLAAMTGMTLEAAWRLYREDAMAGAHPDDLEYVSEQMAAYIESGENHSELVYRNHPEQEENIPSRPDRTDVRDDGAAGQGVQFAV